MQVLFVPNVLGVKDHRTSKLQRNVYLINCIKNSFKMPKGQSQ